MGRSQAIINGTVVAESTECVKVEGNWYFPPGSLNKEYFTLNEGKHTTCPWKGSADYYNISVPDSNNGVLRDGAWTYPHALPKAKHIEGYFAFYERGGLTVNTKTSGCVDYVETHCIVS